MPDVQWSHYKRQHVRNSGRQTEPDEAAAATPLSVSNHWSLRVRIQNSVAGFFFPKNDYQRWFIYLLLARSDKPNTLSLKRQPLPSKNLWKIYFCHVFHFVHKIFYDMGLNLHCMFFWKRKYMLSLVSTTCIFVSPSHDISHGALLSVGMKMGKVTKGRPPKSTEQAVPKVPTPQRLPCLHLKPQKLAPSLTTTPPLSREVPGMVQAHLVPKGRNHTTSLFKVPSPKSALNSLLSVHFENTICLGFFFLFHMLCWQIKCQFL